MMNYLAIVLATLASFGVGMLWYSPALFAKPWMKLSGIDPKKAKPTLMVFLSALIVGLASTIILWWMLAYTATTTIMGAMVLAFILWLGFIATNMFGMVLYEQKPLALYMIHTFQHLAAMLVGSIILVIMG